MQVKWAQLGFIGATLLAIYGFVYFTLYALPEAFFGAQGASVLALSLAWVGGTGGVLSACGFLAYYLELGERSGWRFLLVVCDLVIGVIAWGQQFLAHLALARGLFDLGAQWYRLATPWLMVCFLAWGFTLFSVRKELGTRGRYATYAAVLFLINSLGWIGYLGIGVLTLASLLHACVLIKAPPGFITPKRQYQIGQLGLALLALYWILASRWLVNGVFPLPLAVATPLNFVALASVWVAVLGLGIAFNRFEVHYGNPIFSSAAVVSIGGLLILSLADFTWLMSNVSVSVDPLWGLLQYWSAPHFWLWGDLPLCLASLLSGAGFLQVYVRARRKANVEIPLLGVIFFVSAFFWLYGLGYLPLIAAAPLVLRLFMRIERSSWQPTRSE